MKKWVLLGLIVFLAFILRFYHLGFNPPSLDWDEASLGWNAYSILKTGSDEYGKAWPVSIRSFNDYKPPLYVYAAVPSVALFGLTEFGVRAPSALAGLLTVVAVFFLTAKLTGSHRLALLAAFLFALSPWSLQFSRVAFETNLALFFFVLGVALVTYYLERPRILLLAGSFIFFIAAIYSYHSPRVVVPVFLAGLTIYHRRLFWQHRRDLIIAAAAFFLMLFPLIRNTANSQSLTARFSGVSVFQDETMKNHPGNLLPLLAKNYLDHFNFDFLFLTGDSNPRHHAPDVGVLYLFDAPFVFLGLFWLIRHRPKWWFLPIMWLLAAPAASALTMPTPHAVRSLLLLLPLVVLSAYGLSKATNRSRILSGLLCLLLSVNVYYYLDQYHVQMPVESAKDWQWGYKEVVRKVLAVEKSYDRIYVTSAYDQPYIYFLFYGRISPVVKNSGYFYQTLDKYKFDVTKNDRSALYVVAPQDQVTSFQAFDQINFPDGTTAFLIGKKR